MTFWPRHWANKENYKEWNIKIIFFLTKPPANKNLYVSLKIKNINRNVYLFKKMLNFGPIFTGCNLLRDLEIFVIFVTERQIDKALFLQHDTLFIDTLACYYYQKKDISFLLIVNYEKLSCFKFNKIINRQLKLKFTPWGQTMW